MRWEGMRSMWRLKHKCGCRWPALGFRSEVRGSILFATLGVRHRLSTDGGRGSEQQRLVRHYDPGDYVWNETDAGHDRRDQPHHPHQADVEVKVLSETEAHAGDFTPCPWTYQFGTGQRSPDTNAAVGANRRIVLNQFSAVVAVHGFALHSMVRTQRPKVPLGFNVWTLN